MWEVNEDEPHSKDWDVNVYISVDDDNLSKDNYRWKSDYGVCRFEIDPNTDKFKLGLYRVLFVTTRSKKAAASKSIEQIAGKPSSIQLAMTLLFEDVPEMVKLNGMSDPL